MILRDHPQMSFRDFRNWPPVWVRVKDIASSDRRLLQGEIGTLKHAHRHQAHGDRIFLLIEHEGQEYISCLLFDGRDYCLRIADHLQRCCGLPIEAIGDSEIVSVELRLRNQAQWHH